MNNFRKSTDASANHDADPLPDPELDMKALVEDGEGGWLEDVVCPVRVLYVGHSETQLHGAQLSAGLPQPGLYGLLVRYQSCMSYPSMHLTDLNIFKCLYREAYIELLYFHVFAKKINIH